VDELGRSKGTVSASDETFADVIHPGIEIVKEGAELAHEGDTITYTFEVTNTGDVDLSDVEVTDDVLGAIGTIDDLAVGATETLEKEFVVPEDTDGVDNIGTACGTDIGSVEVCDDDPHSLLVIHPDVEIVKTANPTSAEPGQTITYTYEVTNAGDTTLTDILVTDDILGDIGTIDELEPGESVTLTKTMVVEADSPRTNIGEACGTDALEQEVCDDDDATISIVLPAPPEPRLPATGFRALLWTAFGMALVAAGLAMLEHKRVWLANKI
jgi:archaellum component FlaG (FlaF/FlaG flagellin family)